MAKDLRLELEIESDSFQGIDERKIVDQVIEDYADGVSMMDKWLEDRRKDVQMYEGAKPSEIEGLSKEPWQSDRNMGLTAASCDAYQATLLATCYNPDTIHFVATEENDLDRRDNLTKFSKWMVGSSECNIKPEVDDFISNRIQQGTSVFKVTYDVWDEWVDLRIPRYGATGDFIGYKIETKLKRFERGNLSNIDNLEDLIVPTFGKTLQDKAFIIHVLHKTPNDLEADIEANKFNNVDKSFIDKIKGSQVSSNDKRISEEKAKELGTSKETGVGVQSLRNVPIDILEWYGVLTVAGKTERFRCHVEPSTQTLLSIKPLRKITRSGKYPFVGGALIRRPGFWHGKSLPRLIAPVVNAFNNVWNQKSDFQYFENCPFFFFKPDENFQKAQIKLMPGLGVPTDDPTKINVPNLSRSMAWAQQDMQQLDMLLEKLTGAASYFTSNNQNVSGTATRDVLINQKSEVRFGLWVTRIMDDISEAITMLLNMYQDWAPPNLGERILGENGKRLFQNFTLASIRGGYDARLTEDVIAGSKTLERNVAMWGLETLQKTVWFNPQINPRGNWQLVKNAAKKFGVEQIDNIMPPEPPAMDRERDNVKQKWAQLMQGELPEVKQTDNAMELFSGITQLYEEKKGSLEEEVVPNVENFLFHLSVAMVEQVKATYQSMMANQLALKMMTGQATPPMPPQMGQPSIGVLPGAVGQPTPNTMAPAQVMGQPGGMNVSPAGRVGNMAQSI